MRNDYNDETLNEMTGAMIGDIMKDRSERFRWQFEKSEKDDLNRLRKPILKFLRDYSLIHGKVWDQEGWEIFLAVVRGGVWQEEWDDPRGAISKVCHAMC